MSQYSPCVFCDLSIATDPDMRSAFRVDLTTHCVSSRQRYWITCYHICQRHVSLKTKYLRTMLCNNIVNIFNEKSHYGELTVKCRWILLVYSLYYGAYYTHSPGLLPEYPVWKKKYRRGCFMKMTAVDDRETTYPHDYYNLLPACSALYMRTVLRKCLILAKICLKWSVLTVAYWTGLHCSVISRHKCEFRNFFP